jgi:hypothetical protein
MWWKWVIKALLMLSQNPKAQAWARLKALKAINRIRSRTEQTTADLFDAAGLVPSPKPKMGRLIRTERDILKPGQVAVVEGKAYRVVRLISSHARETVYEAVEA